MKFIKYKKQVGETNIGTYFEPVFDPILQDMGVEYSPENEALVKQIAYNGEYTIEDDGQLEQVIEPTQLDIIEAQVTYTAMMTDTLLEV